LKALREFDPLAGLPILLELATLAAMSVLLKDDQVGGFGN
jgi:hypothetical protein